MPREIKNHQFFRAADPSAVNETLITPDTAQDRIDDTIEREEERQGMRFNPILLLVWLFIGGFIILELIRFSVPASYYQQYLGHQADLIILMISALGAAFIVTTLGFFRLLILRRKNRREYALMETVLEGSLGGRMVCSPEGRLLYKNSRFDDLLGGVEIDSANPFKALDGFFKNHDAFESQDFSFKDLWKLAQTGETQELERWIDVNGDKRCYAISLQALKGWRGHIHLRLDDITDRRAFEEKLGAERKRLLDFMDNALVGFFSVNQEGRFVFANSTLARWLGLDQEDDFIHYQLHDFLENKPAGAAPYNIVAQGGAHQAVELNLIDKDGESFPVAISHTVVCEDETNIYTQSIVRNLSHEKEIRDALRASEDRFHRFFEDAPTGILLISEEGTIEEANRSFQKMIDRQASRIVGKSIKEQIKLEYHSLIDQLIDVMKSGGAGSIENGAAKTMADIDGIEVELQAPSNLPVQLSASRLRGASSFIVHVADLSKQKQLETQFTQSQKMQAVGQLAGGVAHDFNNLLTAMIGFCDLLLERHRAGDPSFQDLMQIKQNANRAANLVRQLLAFSRQQTLRPQILDASDILADLSNLLRRLIGVKIGLKLNHGRDLWHIKADHGQMEQVFINLVVNARDAMADKESGTIEILTTNFENEAPIELVSDVMPEGQWLRVEVKDEGHGISTDNLSRIFDPFFTTKKMGEGTGLGLSTVYGIVRQTGGYIDVISIEGEGTSFVIFLPKVSAEDMAKRAEEKKEEDHKTKDLTGSASILLVEDEEAVRKFSARALGNKGYEVIEAENGVQALASFEEMDVKPGLIITDVMMPEMDGPTFAKKVHETHPDTKIMFVSGFSEDRISDYAGDNIYFLAKPFSLKALAAKVKEILEES